MTQDELVEVYIQEVEGRLHQANEDLAWRGLCRWLDFKSQWGFLHASAELGPNAVALHRYSGGDPVCVAAYRIWLKAHLAAKGHAVFVASNAPAQRVLMPDRVPKATGSFSDDLVRRLDSPDPLVRGTALGDIARGWV